MTATSGKWWTQLAWVCASGIGIGCHLAPAWAEDGQGWWQTAKEHVSTVANEGDWDLYLSGYAHHSRSTYNSTRVRKLNEKAWGGGFGKTYRNADGNEESLYVMAIRDSNYNTQWTAGYAYQWKYPIGGSGFEVGAGLTAALISRKDWFHGVPFPALLPAFSAGTEHVQLMASYVPRLSTRRGKGDVLLMFVKLNF
jgi:palmitoyl transferase